MYPPESPLSSAERDLHRFPPQVIRLVRILARAAAKQYVDSQQADVEGDPPQALQDVANEGGPLR